MKVAIDGPAGCGKSTIARMIADNFGFLYINSGNLYRAVTCLALQEKVSWQDSPAMIALVQRHRFDYLPDGSVDIDGKRLAGELRTPEVDAIVSQVSAIPKFALKSTRLSGRSPKERMSSAKGAISRRSSSPMRE